jgi:lipopolysaccharide/colanic/teichoic acid biosynthesis glycosyltransferase
MTYRAAVQQGGFQGSTVAAPPLTRVAKRTLDIAVASLCLALASPLFVLVVVLVRLTSPGPALFRQVRLGQDRRPFVLLKFRTMYTGSSDEAHREYVTKLLTEDQPSAGGTRGLYKLENDPRVTRVGRLFRRASIDELPQLLNVIKGDMSLVGPRPALPWEAAMFGDGHDQRFAVPPGLTGLWQVSGRNSLTMRQGLDLDIEYVQTQSLARDIVILLKTVPVVLSARGAQ